jgi:hypothetical protein
LVSQVNFGFNRDSSLPPKNENKKEAENAAHVLSSPAAVFHLFSSPCTLIGLADLFSNKMVTAPFH